MQIQQRPLKVHIHYDESDRETVLLLGERLTRDGVNVSLGGDSLVEGSTADEIYKLIGESDVVIFCLSMQFNKIEVRRKATRTALETILEKSGDSSVVPVRLEDSGVPVSLRKWQSVDLFEENGYERLLLALKVRADRVGAFLPVKKDLLTRLDTKKVEPQKIEMPESVYVKEQSKKSRPRGLLFAVLFLALLAVFLLRNKLFAPSVETPVSADVLAENATQNAQAFERNRAATITAVAFAFSDPLTQTAIYQSNLPLTRTAEYEISLYTPTLTPSPTITLTPRTIVALPPELIDANNVPMVLVPEGGFRMGSDNGNVDVKPEYGIYLLAYYIDKYEVTNAVYKPCVDAGVCQPPESSSSQKRSDYYGNPEYDKYPVINVNLQMARQFCEWRGARLPSEAEWEKAARGTEGRVYPWHDGLGCSFANYEIGSAAACVGDTVQVGQYDSGKSIYGAFDMAGNVYEWVSSLLMPYPYNSLDGREDPDASGRRVLRGGSWASSAEQISTFYRLSADPTHYSVAGNDTGFRCARNANP